MAVRNRTLTDNVPEQEYFIFRRSRICCYHDASELANVSGTGNRLDIKERVVWIKILQLLLQVQVLGLLVAGGTVGKFDAHTITNGATLLDSN